jgi:hypothetical protein
LGFIALSFHLLLFIGLFVEFLGFALFDNRKQLRLASQLMKPADPKKQCVQCGEPTLGPAFEERPFI